MPKQKLTELQRRRELLRKNVKLLQGGRTNADMGEIIGKCANSYQNKMNRPDTFTFGEICLLSAKFKIDITDLVGAELKITVHNHRNGKEVDV